jgi:hypothetical protein
MSIEIKEHIEDKDSWFNIKRFKISNLNVEGPLKAIDINNIDDKIFSSIQHNFKLFEYSKTINYKSIERMLEANEENYIRRYFKPRRLDVNYAHINVVILTFNFNPYQLTTMQRLSGFLDYYHQYTDLLFVPNIKRYKYNETTKSKEEIIKIEDYLRAVDEMYEILNLNNKKPIFVPITLKSSMEEIDKMVKHYIDKEYYLYWVDFEGKAISERTIAIITHINRLLKENGVIKNILLYFTNIKREIISSPIQAESPASDVLATLIGSNIVGINKEPPRAIGEDQSLTKLREKELWEHKARLFDNDSYYYIKISELKREQPDKEILMDKRYNIIYNSMLLDKEFKRQAEYFISKQEIKSMLEVKRMLREYREGQLLNVLFQTELGREDMKLTDFI